jgi:ribonuclease J
MKNGCDNMIDIKVFNADQIGGCFTVITTAKAKIMIDYGLPLPGAKATQEDFNWDNDTVDAVFITHYHGDHVGRLLEVPAHIPIYMGRGTREILLNIHETLVNVENLEEEQERWIQLLRSNQIKVVEENKPITEIEGIVIPIFPNCVLFRLTIVLPLCPSLLMILVRDFIKKYI